MIQTNQKNLFNLLSYLCKYLKSVLSDQASLGSYFYFYSVPCKVNH